MNLRAQLLTPVGWPTNSPASSPQHVVPANYRPATPIYSPTSPDYSPSMSPVHVDTDNSDNLTPPHNSDGAITTRDCEMFDLVNTDSDQEIEGEAETISLVGDYINRGKLPVKMQGVFIFPQPAHVHNLTWNEYPFEPCSNHCVMPERSDKSLPRFYLTHSLCLKHRASLCNMGPWIYLCNRVSTLPKLHKSPQILNFITLLHNKIKGDQRVKDYLVVCQLVETLGLFTLLIRVDIFMANNPLELKSWVQIYNLNDQIDFWGQNAFLHNQGFHRQNLWLSCWWLIDDKCMIHYIYMLIKYISVQCLCFSLNHCT